MELARFVGGFYQFRMRSLWKWLRRIGIVIFCLLAVVYLFVLARARIPVAVHDEDLLLPRVSVLAESNAFDRLEQAAEHLQVPEEDRLRISQDLIGMTNWDEAYVSGLLETNAAALQGWKEAVSLPAMQVPEFSMLQELPGVWEWRHLSQLASLRETSLMVHGQTNEAFDAMLAHAKLGIRMQNAHGGVIHYLAGAALVAESLKTIRQWTTNASVDRLKAGIDSLSSLRNAESEALANSIKGEYAGQKQAMEDIRSGRYYERVEHGSIRPGLLIPSFYYTKTLVPSFNYTKTVAMLARADRSLVEAAPLHYGEMKELDFQYRGGVVAPFLSGNYAGLVMYHLTMPAMSAILVKKCNVVANIDATRTILAVRAYQLAHGKLPEQLSDLVPQFLDKVPVDDFDGQPLRYLPVQKVVYSVGKNLKDDGGDDRGEEEWNTSERHLDTAFHFNF